MTRSLTLLALLLLAFVACAPFDPGRSEAGNWLTVLSNVTPLPPGGAQNSGGSFEWTG